MFDFIEKLIYRPPTDTEVAPFLIGTDYACVDRRALEFSSRPIFAKRGDDFVESSAFNIFLQSPDGKLSFGAWLQKLEHQLSLFGLVVLECNVVAGQFRAKFVKRNRISIREDEVYIDNRLASEFRDDVRYLVLLEDYINGFNKKFIETRILSGAERAIILQGNRYAKNGERPYFLNPKEKDYNPGAIESFLKRFNRKNPLYNIDSMLPNDFELLPLPDGGGLREIVKDMNLEQITQMICRLRQVPRNILDYQFNGKATAQESLYNFNSMLIDNLLNERIGLINKIVSEFGIQDYLAWDNYVINKEEDNRVHYEWLLSMGLITQNQILEELKMEARTDGDKYYIKTGLIEDTEFGNELD